MQRASVCLFQERLLSRGCLPAESCLSAVCVYLKEPREGQGRDKCRLCTTRDGLGATRKGPCLRCCWFESAPFRPTSSGVPSSPAALLPTLHPSRVALLIPHHPFSLGVSWWQGPKRRWRRTRRDWGIMTERLVLNWAPLTITAWPLASCFTSSGLTRFPIYRIRVISEFPCRSVSYLSGTGDLRQLLPIPWDL